MTDREVYDSYTFVHLSNVAEYNFAVHLDGQLGDHQDIPGGIELPDETWEIVVHRLYMPIFIDKLKHRFPNCCIYSNYDPTKPSAAEIEQFGSYNRAKELKEISFLYRAQYMEGAWDTAAKYYSLRAKEIRGGAVAAEIV